VISSVSRQIAFKMLQLLRALCMVCFLISVVVLIAALTDHKLFKHPIIIPTVIALSLFFLSWYLLPIFLEKMQSTFSNTDHMKQLRMENSALKLEVQRLSCLYDDSKERFLQKDKQFRKSFLILAVVARSLVAWEQSKGKISAEEAFVSLREELRRLNIEGEDDL
jgi:Zn-dependent protease with chaperone function